MQSAEDDIVAGIAARIAEGESIDWVELQRSGKLSETKVEALQTLTTIRELHRDSVPLDTENETGFEIRSELGRGSYGTVYRAFDRSLQREVALKVIESQGQLTTHLRDRFLREARTLASLKHPNIVQIYSVEQSGSQYTLCLELIEGKTLDETVQSQGTFSPLEAAQIAVDLCKAMAAIHSRGLVHLDLKPKNVMREKGGRTVLLDFGLVRSTVPEFLDATEWTSGTPMVMAPEQFEPESPVDARTDLYAMGVLLYWMVSGKYPCDATNFAALRSMVLNGDVVALGDRRSDLPSEFVGIVMKLLSRRPADRFVSTGALQGELQRWRSKSHGRRRPWAVAAVAFVVLLLSLLAFRHFSPGTPSLFFQGQMYLDQGREQVPLAYDAAITVGNRLSLEVMANQDAYVYVINEDMKGERWILFPMPGLQLQNPLPGGQTHELPGKTNDQPEAKRWTVTSAGGGYEKFLIVASVQPLQVIEELFDEIPVVGSGPRQLSARQTQDIVRGVGGFSGIAAPPVASTEEPAVLLLDEIFERLEPGSTETQGVFRRMLRLRNLAE